MTKKQEEIVPEEVASPSRGVISECPTCKASLFQGPFTRGKFLNGEFTVTEMVYQCRNCHNEWTPDQLHPRAIGS